MATRIAVGSTRALPGQQGWDAGAASDEELARRGGVEDFTDLYRRHRGPLYAYLYARLQSREDAEDVTSAVFTKAWRHLRSYRGNGTFRSWLFAIAHRALADHQRRRRRTDPLSDAAEAAGPGPEQTLEDRARWAQAHRLLQGLTPEQREVIALRFIADLPYAEIARAVGKSPSAVKMVAYRALHVMRGRLQTDEERA